MSQKASQKTLKDKAQDLKGKIYLLVEKTYPNEFKFVRTLLITQMTNELNTQVVKLTPEEILDYFQKQTDNLQSNLDNQYLIIKQQYKNYILIANDIYTQTVNQVKQQNCYQFTYFNNIIDQVMKSAQSQYYQKIEYLPSESQFKTHCKSVLDPILKQERLYPNIDTYNKEAKKAVDYANKKYESLQKNFNKYTQTNWQQIKENLFKSLYQGWQQGMNESKIDELINVKNLEYQVQWGKEVEMLKVKEIVQANYPNDFEFIRIQLISQILKDIELQLSGNTKDNQKQQYIKKQETDLQQTVESQYKQIKEYFKKHIDIATEMYEFHQQSVLKQTPLAFTCYKEIVNQQLSKTYRDYLLRIQAIQLQGDQFKKHCEQIFNESFYGPPKNINFETFKNQAQNAYDYVNLKFNSLKTALNENPSIKWDEEKKKILEKLHQEWYQGMENSKIDAIIDLKRYEQVLIPQKNQAYENKKIPEDKRYEQVLIPQQNQAYGNKKIPEQEKQYVKQKVEAMQQRIIKDYKEHEVRFLNWEQIKNQVFTKFYDGWKPKMEEYECDELLELKKLENQLLMDINLNLTINAFINLAAQKGHLCLFDEEYEQINQNAKIKEIQKPQSKPDILASQFYEEIFKTLESDQQIVVLKNQLIDGISASNLIPKELTQNISLKQKVNHLYFNHIRELACKEYGNCSCQQFKKLQKNSKDLLNKLLGYLTKEPEQIKSLTQSIQKEYCEWLEQIRDNFKNKIPSEEEYKLVVNEQDPLFLQIVHPSNSFGLDDDQEEYLEKQIDKFQRKMYLDWLTECWNKCKQDLKNYQEIQEDQLTQKLKTFQDQIVNSIQNKLQQLNQGEKLVVQFKTRWKNDKWEEKVYSYFGKLLQGQQQGMDDSEIDELIDLNKYQQLIQERKKIQETLKMQKAKVQDFVEATYPNDFQFIKQLLIQKINKEMETSPDFLKKFQNNMQHTVQEQSQLIVQQYKFYIDCALERFTFNQNIIQQEPCFQFVFYQIVQQRLAWSWSQYVLQLQFIQDPDQFRIQCQELFYKLLNQPIEGQQTMNLKEFNENAKQVLDYVSTKCLQMQKDINDKFKDDARFLDWGQIKQSILCRLYQGWNPQMEQLKYDEILKWQEQVINMEIKFIQTINAYVYLAAQKGQYYLFDEEYYVMNQSPKIKEIQQLQLSPDTLASQFYEEIFKTLTTYPNIEILKKALIDRISAMNLIPNEFSQNISQKKMVIHLHFDHIRKSSIQAYGNCSFKNFKIHFPQDQNLVNMLLGYLSKDPQYIKSLTQVIRDKQDQVLNQIMNKYKTIIISEEEYQQVIDEKDPLFLSTVHPSITNGFDKDQEQYLEKQINKFQKTKYQDWLQNRWNQCKQDLQNFQIQIQEQLLNFKFTTFQNQITQQIEIKLQDLNKTQTLVDQFKTRWNNDKWEEKVYSYFGKHLQGKGMDDRQIDEMMDHNKYQQLIQEKKKIQETIKMQNELKGEVQAFVEDTYTNDLQFIKQLLIQKINKEMEQSPDFLGLLKDLMQHTVQEQYNSIVQQYKKYIDCALEIFNQIEQYPCYKFDFYYLVKQRLTQIRNQYVEKVKFIEQDDEFKKQCQDLFKRLFNDPSQQQINLEQFNQNVQQALDYVTTTQNKIKNDISVQYGDDAKQLDWGQTEESFYCKLYKGWKPNMKEQEYDELIQIKEKEQEIHMEIKVIQTIKAFIQLAAQKGQFYLFDEQYEQIKQNAKIKEIQQSQSSPDEFVLQIYEDIFKSISQSQPIEKLKQALIDGISAQKQIPTEVTENPHFKGKVIYLLFKYIRDQADLAQQSCSLQQLKTQYTQDQDLVKVLLEYLTKEPDQINSLTQDIQKEYFLGKIRTQFKTKIISEEEYKQVVNEQDPSFLKIVHPSNSFGLDTDQVEYLEKQIDKFQKDKYQGWLQKCWNLLNEELKNYQDIQEDQLTEKLKTFQDEIVKSIGNKLQQLNQGETLVEQFKKRWIQDWEEKVVDQFVEIYTE